MQKTEWQPMVDEPTEKMSFTPSALLAKVSEN